MPEWISRYWITWVFGLITLGLSVSVKRLYGRVRKEFEEQRMLKDGLKAILRNDIIQEYNHYIDKGWCPIYGLENVESMYKQYHNLGGDGAVTNLVEQIRRLPHHEPKGAKQ